jgi:ferredoxin
MTNEVEAAGSHYSVDPRKCFRCGACSSLVPGVFVMAEASARVAREPAGEAERRRCEVARLNCPGHAIRREKGAAEAAVGAAEAIAGATEAGVGAAEPGAGAVSGVSEPLFPQLFNEAERVRWRMGDIDWGAIEKERVSPGFVQFVREVALSELTTFSATRRFLTEMADDVDFTQWVSIWFYEETKHPDALLRWLASFGVTVDARAVLRGRVTAPFMRSRTGTLVMNILSELFASAGYQYLTRYSKEPVLAHVTRCLAGDEARHGASFYAYAERAIGLSKTPELERLQALKVLYYWVGATDQVEHPVNQFHVKVSADPELSKVLAAVGTDYAPARARACRMIGTLIGRRLAEPEDVLPALREMSAACNQAV